MASTSDGVSNANLTPVSCFSRYSLTESHVRHCCACSAIADESFEERQSLLFIVLSR